MTVRSIACGACGAEVQPGRLSCPACGELLASVSGGRSMATAGPSAAVRITTDTTPLLDALMDDPVGEDAAPEPEPEPEVESSLEPDPGAEPDLDPEPGPVAASRAAYPAILVDAEPAAAEPPPPSWSTRPSEPPPPGAYVPPSLAPVGASAVAGFAAMPTAMPAGPAAPARTWAGVDPHAVDRPAESSATDAGAAAAAGDRVDEMIGWVAVAGCALAGLGFLIPWSRTVIGAGGVSYTDQWGLAGPGALIVVLALAAIGVLAVLPNPVPAWVRLGIPGLAVGTLLVGLVWPYALGPLGALPGAMLSLAGALLLAVAAIVCLVVDRHERSRSPV